MTLLALLIELRARRVCIERDGDDLVVRAPKGAITPVIVEAMKEHKQALLNLPRPYINKVGDLVTPTYAPPQYHWRSIEERLVDAGAPSEVWRNYSATPYPGSLNGQGANRGGNNTKDE